MSYTQDIEKDEKSGRKLHILIIMGRYLPGYKDGGPVRSIKNLVDRLGDEYDFHILTVDRDHGDKVSYMESCPELHLREEEWNQIGKAKVYYVKPHGFDDITVEKLAKGADLIYMCGCFNDYARTTMKLKKQGKITCKVVVAAMGLFSPGAFRIKYPKKKAYVVLLKLLGYFKNIEWSATDKTEADDIRKQIGKNAICHLAEDLPRKPEKIVHETITDKGSLRIIFLSRISRKKNLLFAIKILQRIKEGHIIFDIYGNKEDPDYWRECEQELEKLPDNVTWSYQGPAEAEEVVTIFSKYDVFLFPTLAENYGHVVFEAMAGGCVPVISDRTPWNSEKTKNALSCIVLRDDEKTDYLFAQEIGKFINLSKDSMQNRADACMIFADCYRADVAENQYREIFNSVVEVGT